MAMLRCLVLVLHRRDDRMVPVDFAYETQELLQEAGVDVTLRIVEGDEHYSFAGDVDSIVDEIERFVTGTVAADLPKRPKNVSIQTLGGFEVRVGGEAVPTSEWGSKRARMLLQRLCVAQGWPVTRDELIDVLWPDDDSPRLSARLSVQLSNVRRVLGGGVIADRSTARLDVDAVDLDLVQWLALEDPAELINGFSGELSIRSRSTHSSPDDRKVFERVVRQSAGMDTKALTPDMIDLAAVAEGDGDHRFFLNHLATVKVSAGSSLSGMNVVEFDAPKDFGPPLHQARTRRRDHVRDQWRSAAARRRGAGDRRAGNGRVAACTRSAHLPGRQRISPILDRDRGIERSSDLRSLRPGARRTG